MLGIGNGAVRAKLGLMESEMEEFELSSDSWNREWRSSKPTQSMLGCPIFVFQKVAKQIPQA